MTAVASPKPDTLRGRRALWTITPKGVVSAADLSPMLCHLLEARGYESHQEMRDFLSADGVDHDPFGLPDMAAAVERIQRAARDKERVGIYGDFDCDGLTAAAVVRSVLGSLGIDSNVIIPTRLENHGLRGQRIVEMAEAGVTLIITADCGIGDVEPVERARRLGMDVIVTDHHQPNADGSLPNALVISATRSGSVYPWPQLSGVGVAYKLAQALLPPEDADRLLDLVAMGTVADVVPLRDENRSLVLKGLGQLMRTERTGLKALFRVAGVDGRRVNAASIGFYLGPRINAANRIDDPRVAFDLIVSDSPEDAEELAGILNAHNLSRQDMVERHTRDLIEQIGPPAEVTVDVREGRRPPIICVKGDWPPGISGLLASSLTDRYSVPAIVATKRTDGIVAASGRSVRDVNILDLVRAAKAVVRGGFLGEGGHSMACGFTAEEAAFPAITRALESEASLSVAVGNLGAEIRVDAQVRLRQLDMAALDLVERLGPYGRDFPEPAFLARGVYLQRRSSMGPAGKHLRGTVCSGEARMPAVMFNVDPALASSPESEPVDLVFNLSRDQFGESSRAQITIKDWRPFSSDQESDLRHPAQVS